MFIDNDKNNACPARRSEKQQSFLTFWRPAGRSRRRLTRCRNVHSSSIPASRAPLAPREAPSMQPRRSTPSTKRSPPFTRTLGSSNLPLHPYTLLTCEAWHLSTRALIYHTRWAQVQLMRPYKAAAHFLRRRGCKPIKRATTQSSSTSSSPTLRSWTLAPSVLDNTCLGGVGRCAGCLQRKSVVGTTAQGHE